MLSRLAIQGYRSLRDFIVPLEGLNLVTGPNGSGKSNVYRALRLLADVAQGRVIPSLAREGGLQSTLADLNSCLSWRDSSSLILPLRTGTGASAGNPLHSGGIADFDPSMPRSILALSRDRTNSHLSLSQRHAEAT